MSQMKTKEELSEEIRDKIQQLEKSKLSTTVPSQYEQAISNLYIALSNLYK